MRNISKTYLIGNLGADPEMRYTATGRAVARFRVAVSTRWRDPEGQLRERTDWYTCVAWSRLAEVVKQYTSKGSTVFVDGQLQTRSYEQNGEVRYITELVAKEVIVFPRGNGGNGQGTHEAESEPWEDEASVVEESSLTDEIPL